MDPKQKEGYYKQPGSPYSGEQAKYVEEKMAGKKVEGEEKVSVKLSQREMDARKLFR